MRSLSPAIRIIVFLCVGVTLLGQTETPTEDRIDRLELRIEQLLERVEQLESLLIQPDRATAEAPLDDHEPPERKPDPVSGESDPISIEITVLHHERSGLQNNWANDGLPFLRIAFEFTNNLDTETRAIRGMVVFSDFFQDEWWRLPITMSDPIPPGQTAIWEGMISYNSRMSAHEQARYTPTEHIVVHLEDLEVVFVDGSRQRF